MPDLGLWRCSEAYLSSNLAAQFLPPPSASVVQYGYFCRAGYPFGHTSQIAAGGSFLFPTVGRFLLPVVAVVLLALTGEIPARS